MARLNLLTATAVAAVLGIAGAQAADMPVYYEQPAEPEFGGWYIRGDVGASHQVSDDIDSPRFDEIAAAGTIHDLQMSEWDASWFIGAGVGYRFNDWLRADITGEYRFKSDFDGRDTYDDTPTGDIDGSNVYDGDKQEAVFLLNGYIDLPSYGRMTPFVGAGVGASWIEISNFSDIDPVSLAAGFSGDTTTWNFAWALHAGLAFEINPNMTFELAYRYLHMGDAETEDLVTSGGLNGTFNPFEFDNIASHDVKVGLRYTFN